jgi:hypothetical protein
MLDSVYLFIEQVLADRYRLALSVFREGLRQREKFNERRAVRHWRAALFYSSV